MAAGWPWPWAAVLVLVTWRPLPTGGTAEYLGTLLLAIAGLMLTAAAGDLVLLFVGLELISIPTYVLLYLGRRDAASQEAAAKYFFLSILSSAMLLYGLSFLYGTAGSTQLAAIRAGVADPAATCRRLRALLKVAMVLIFAGLSFRIAAVPFHFYAPDVYQGTTHANAALLSVLPKAAGLLVLVRLVLAAMPGQGSYAWPVALALAVAHDDVRQRAGALARQPAAIAGLFLDRQRRLHAHRPGGRAGHDLGPGRVGTASPPCSSTSASTRRPRWAPSPPWSIWAATRQQVEAVDELAGLGRTRPAAAAAIALFMFSLAGLPPLAGLWGKLLIFGSARGRPRRRRRQRAAVVRGGRGHRRAQRGRGGRLLPADRGRDVLSHAAGHAQGPRRSRPLVGNRRLRGGGAGLGGLPSAADAGLADGQCEIASEQWARC